MDKRSVARGRHCSDLRKQSRVEAGDVRVAHTMEPFCVVAVSWKTKTRDGWREAVVVLLRKGIRAELCQLLVDREPSDKVCCASGGGEACVAESHAADATRLNQRWRRRGWTTRVRTRAWRRGDGGAEDEDDEAAMPMHGRTSVATYGVPSGRRLRNFDLENPFNAFKF